MNWNDAWQRVVTDPNPALPVEAAPSAFPSAGSPPMGDILPRTGAPPGDASDIMRKMIESQSPLLGALIKGKNLPAWATGLMALGTMGGGKIGFAKGPHSFGINLGAASDAYAGGQMQDMLKKYLDQGEQEGAGGGTAPAVMKNDATQTTPVSRVSPVRVGDSGLQSPGEMLSSWLEQPRRVMGV